MAPIFALAAIPMIGLTGAAVDYSRANSVRTSMQAGLDATSLMLSRDALSLSQAQLTQKANDYFMALFSRPEASNVQITPAFTTPRPGASSSTSAAPPPSAPRSRASSVKTR